jgi:hypothetical protein
VTAVSPTLRTSRFAGGGGGLTAVDELVESSETEPMPSDAAATTPALDATITFFVMAEG